MRHLLAPFFLLFVVGCAQTLRDDPAIDPVVACVSYKSLQGTVNDVIESGQLSDEQIISVGERVQQSNRVVIGTEAGGYTDGLCTGPELPDTNSAAAQRILVGLSNLVEIQQEIQ